MAGISTDENPDIKIQGDSDGTLIGNIGDSLKVTMDENATPGSAVFTNKYRAEVDATDVNLTTSYATVYTYSGSGKFISFTAELDKSTIKFKATVDGTEVLFNDITMSDLGLLDFKGQCRNGLDATADGKKFFFNPKYPIVYNTSILIEAATTTGTAKVLTHSVTLTKET